MSKATISLNPGSVVGFKGEDWLITEQDSFARVLAERISDGRRDFLPIAELVPAVVTQPPPKKTRAPVLEKDAPAEAAKDVKRAQLLYVALVAVSKIKRNQRRDAVVSLCDKFKFSLATAYRLVKRVESGESADDLYRKERFDKKGTGSRVGKETLAIIRDRLRKHYFVAERRSIPDILDLINGDLRAKDRDEVGRMTVYRVRDEISYKKSLEFQGRKKQARDLFRPSVGHLPDADYPLAVVQVDHTPIQVCLVDQETRQAIGDAWLTLVIDCYSRMVLAFYVSLDAPSTLTTGLALAKAFLPKDILLRRLSIQGEWPCWGFPDVVLVDNAAELNGKMMQAARNQHRFTIRDRPIGAPNFGGHVESAFNTFMYELKTIGGTKFSNPKERAEYDSEGKAILTLLEFDWYFTEFLVNDYHLAEHTGEGMRKRAPLQAWRAGIFEGDKFPPIGLPELPADPRNVEISLMPIEWRTVSNATVTIFTESYYSPALQTLSDTINPTKPTEDRLFEIRYDPRDISRIWVRDPDTGGYIEARFSDLGKGSISLWEHNARKKAQGKPADEFKQQRYESKLRREAFKEKKATETKQARRLAEKAKLDAEAQLLRPISPKKKIDPTPRPVRRSPQEIREAMRKKLSQRGGTDG